MDRVHHTDGHHQTGDKLKVVFIQTQYINTDAMSFKSIVQSLTGKDSSCHFSCCLNEEHKISPPSSLATKLLAPDDFSWPSYTSEEDFGYDIAGCTVLDKQSSLRELERLISQLPPVEDLYRLWDNL